MTDNSDDFANHPKSITELKGDRSQNAADWTPRDALINALRDIDAGVIKPTMLIIAYDEGGDGQCGYFTASSSVINSLGLLDYVANRIYETRK